MPPEKRTLGRTGFEVTTVGFGAWAIGTSKYGPVPEAQGKACLEAYLDAGGNFIDTSNSYGDSEAFIGDVVKGADARDRVFISTKGRRSDGPGIRQEVEDSLRGLRSDYIDVYFSHRPPHDPGEMNRVLDVYEELKQEGKIRAIGVSVRGALGADVDWNTPEVSRQYLRTGRVDVVQSIYSILRQRQREIFREAAALDVGIVCRSVLESGFLTGKYPVGHTFDDRRAKWGSKSRASILENVEELKQTIGPYGHESISQVAIRFALDEQEVACALLGAKTVQQVRANLDAGQSAPLDPELRAGLQAAYEGRTEEFNTAPDSPPLHHRLYERLRGLAKR